MRVGVRMLGVKGGLLLKWWRWFEEENEELYRKVIIFKYGEDEWGYKRVPIYCVSKVWGDALKVGDESNIIGEKSSREEWVLRMERGPFLVDPWVGESLLSVLFHKLSRMVSNKISLASDSYEEGGNLVSCNVLFRRVHHFEESKFESLSSILSNVFLCREIADVCIWRLSPLWVFFTVFYYKSLVE